MTGDVISYASADPAKLAEAARRAEVRRLALLFGVVYFSQGVAQVSLLIHQPLNFYLRDGLGWGADRIAGFMWVVMIPWMLKPLYGLLSDFIPILGYRRKSYLLLMNGLAAGAFLWVWGVRDTTGLMVGLLLTGLGVATSDVVVDALMVESGQRTGRVKLFQGVQWTCINIAGIGSSFLGGYLCDRAGAHGAYRVAALISGGVAFAVALVGWFLVREPRAALDAGQLKATGRGVRAAFTSGVLWAVLGFLFLAELNPGMITPLYLFQKEKLGFGQTHIGQLNAYAFAGYAVGAVLFTLLLAPRLSTRSTIVVGLSALLVVKLALLGMRGPASAAAARFVYGIGFQMAILSLLSLAAEACPRRAEAFTFAAMMAVLNLGRQTGDYVGSRLYQDVFGQAFWPVVLVSCGATLGALLLVPLLPRVKPAGGEGDDPTSRDREGAVLLGTEETAP